MSSLKACNVNCRGPLGGEKGEGKLRGRGGQSGTNQGQVWTSIRTTSFKGGIPSKLKVIICKQKSKGCKKGEVEANTT